MSGNDKQSVLATLRTAQRDYAIALQIASAPSPRARFLRAKALLRGRQWSPMLVQHAVRVASEIQRFGAPYRVVNEQGERSLYCVNLISGVYCIRRRAVPAYR